MRYALAFCFLVCCSVARADIVLNLDTGTKEFFFTGFDTGDLGNTGNVVTISWSDGSFSQWDTVLSNPLTGGNGFINFSVPAIGQHAFGLPNQTFNPDGRRFNYGGDVDRINTFESHIGKSLAPNWGTGWSPITIVPEPSGWLLLPFLVLLRRRALRIAAERDVDAGH